MRACERPCVRQDRHASEYKIVTTKDACCGRDLNIYIFEREGFADFQKFGTRAFFVVSQVFFCLVEKRARVYVVRRKRHVLQYPAFANAGYRMRLTDRCTWRHHLWQSFFAESFFFSLGKLPPGIVTVCGGIFPATAVCVVTCY